MHNFKLDDEVWYHVDRAPFKVIGIRKETVEIEGDFSGGTHNVIQSDWVHYSEISIYDKSIDYPYISVKRPRFVKLKNSALRLDGDTYYRDGGCWYVYYKQVNGVLLSDMPDHPLLDNCELIEITEEEWRECNGRYAPKNIS